MSCVTYESLCSTTLWYSPPVPLCSVCPVSGDLVLGGDPAPEGTWPRQPHGELLEPHCGGLGRGDGAVSVPLTTHLPLPSDELHGS